MERKNVYDFEVFKALVEIEVRRNQRRKEKLPFFIAFLYAPNIVQKFKEKLLNCEGIAFCVSENIRASDLVSPVEDDFIFLFFPDTSGDKAPVIIERLRNTFQIDFVEGIASYPEDGQTEQDLFKKLVNIMNEKLIPVIDLEIEKNS